MIIDKEYDDWMGGDAPLAGTVVEFQPCSSLGTGASLRGLDLFAIFNCYCSQMGGTACLTRNFTDEEVGRVRSYLGGLHKGPTRG